MATSLEAGLRHDRTRSEEFHELQASSTEPKSSDHFIEVVKETKDLDASQDWEETPLKCDDGGKRDDGLENDEGLDGGWGWVIVASCSFMSVSRTFFTPIHKSNYDGGSERRQIIVTDSCSVSPDAGDELIPDIRHPVWRSFDFNGGFFNTERLGV